MEENQTKLIFEKGEFVFSKNGIETTIYETIPPAIKFVMNRLIENNFEAFLVGGSVRDAVMGRRATDYDLTTSAEPEKVKTVFEECKIINNNGIKHGTVTVVVEGETVEVTTCRRDAADGLTRFELTSRDKTKIDKRLKELEAELETESDVKDNYYYYKGCYNGEE